MSMVNKKDRCFYWICVFTLTISLLVNPSITLSSEGDGNFDWWSDGLLYSNLIYNASWNEKSYFIKCLDPAVLEAVYGGIWTDYEDVLKNAYLSETNPYPQELFSVYTSNIVIQRYFFCALDELLPMSNQSKLNLVYFINALLGALTISVILLWVAKSFRNYVSGFITLCILAFLSPSLLMYGKNLYWCIWTMFFPAALMILIIDSKIFQESHHKALLLSLGSFVSIFIKCLFYFEFVTTIMISMMIPVAFYLIGLEEIQSKKRGVLTFLTVSTFAIVAFLMVNIIKFYMLEMTFGSDSDALAVIITNLKNRVIGDPYSASEAFAASAKAPLLDVLKIMFEKSFISFKHTAQITQLGLVMLTAAVTVLVILPLRGTETVQFATGRVTSQYRKWIICTWLSLLAPLSWFVLAKPHTFHHSYHCSVVWYIIFDIMATALIFSFLSDNYFTYKTTQFAENKKNGDNRIKDEKD